MVVPSRTLTEEASPNVVQNLLEVLYLPKNLLEEVLYLPEVKNCPQTQGEGEEMVLMSWYCLRRRSFAVD